MWAYLFAEFLSISGVFQYYLFQFIRHRPLAPARDPAPESAEAVFPKVDILIPTYNEPYDIIRKTLIRAVAVDYPNFTVNLLDDGRRPDIKALAEEIGATYFTRDDNKGAKAGNMNAALPRLDGDYLAILDADFMAFDSFLSDGIAGFDDDRIALQQGFETPEDIAKERARIAALDIGDLAARKKPVLVRHRNGDTLEFRITRRWIENPSGKGRLLMIDFVDLTAERKVTEERDKYAGQAMADLEAGTTLFVVRDAEFNIVFMSEPLMQLMGYSRLEDVPPTKEWRVDPSKASDARHIISAAKYGELHELPELVELQTSAGQKLIMRESFRWFWGPQSGAPLLMTSYENVSELVAQESFNETLLVKSPAIILTESRDFRIESCSEAWISTMGYSRDETLGQSLEQFFVPEQRDKVIKERAAFASGARTLGEFRGQLLSKSGRRIDVKINARVDRSIDHWVVILTLSDITDMVRTQEKLTELVEHDELNREHRLCQTGCVRPPVKRHAYCRYRRPRGKTGGPQPCLGGGRRHASQNSCTRRVHHHRRG